MSLIVFEDGVPWLQYVLSGICLRNFASSCGLFRSAVGALIPTSTSMGKLDLSQFYLSPEETEEHLQGFAFHYATPPVLKQPPVLAVFYQHTTNSLAANIHTLTVKDPRWVRDGVFRLLDENKGKRIRLCSASFSLFGDCLPELVSKLAAASSHGSEVELILANPHTAYFEDISPQPEIASERILTLCSLLPSNIRVHKVSKPIFNSTIQIGEEMIYIPYIHGQFSTDSPSMLILEKYNPLYKDQERQFDVLAGRINM